jgi:hypothetical protein
MEPLDRAPLIGQVDARGRKSEVARATLQAVVGAGLQAHVLLAVSLLSRLLRHSSFDVMLRGTGIKLVGQQSDVQLWATSIARSPWRRPGEGFRILASEASTTRPWDAVHLGASAGDYVAAVAPQTRCFIEPLDEELLFYGRDNGREVFERVLRVLDDTSRRP